MFGFFKKKPVEQPYVDPNIRKATAPDEWLTPEERLARETWCKMRKEYEEATVHYVCEGVHVGNLDINGMRHKVYVQFLPEMTGNVFTKSAELVLLYGVSANSSRADSLVANSASLKEQAKAFALEKKAMIFQKSKDLFEKFLKKYSVDYPTVSQFKEQWKFTIRTKFQKPY